jgi:putative transposase
MAQSLSDILVHIVFSTKNRYPWIHSQVEPALQSYICGISRNLDSPVIKINGTEDHIHILASLGKTISYSKLISEIKSNSSRWIKRKGDHCTDFSWQNGYGIFSVSRPKINGVIKYIDNQKHHHKKATFKEEFISMLKASKIEYNEQYLWD